MGSTNSKQARANLQQRYSLLPYQNESIDSKGSGTGDIIKRDHSWDGFHSNRDHPNNYLSHRCNIPLIPQIVSSTSSCKPEVIDTWELAEGIEDFTSINTWEFVDPSESMCCYLDPKILFPSENASEDINPQLNNANKIRKSPLASKYRETLQLLGMVRARINSFERKIDERRVKLGSLSSNYTPVEEKTLVFYFTSLAGIPSTHEDCQDAKAILQGYGVFLDERDVSMEAVLKEELNELLGVSFGGKLPRIFLDECYIGGAEEVRKLHISGKLKNVLQGCKMKAIGKDGNFELCPGCADVRFLPCLSCSGSCRVYLDSTEEGENNFVQFQRCKDCNEYGLIRCPVCW